MEAHGFCAGILEVFGGLETVYTIKNAVELLGAFCPYVEKIQYH
jgi:hypothetical protein